MVRDDGSEVRGLDASSKAGEIFCSKGASEGLENGEESFVIF